MTEMTAADIVQRQKEMDDRIHHKRLTAELTKETFLQMSISTTFADTIAKIDTLDFYAQEYWGYSSEEYQEVIKPKVERVKELIGELAEY